MANADVDGNSVDFVFNLRFPGQYFDVETNTHYNYFRDYEAGTGRYLQSDSIGLDGGINSYAYVKNNVLLGLDRQGLIFKFKNKRKWKDYIDGCFDLIGLLISVFSPNASSDSEPPDEDFERPRIGTPSTSGGSKPPPDLPDTLPRKEKKSPKFKQNKKGKCSSCGKKRGKKGF